MNESLRALVELAAQLVELLAVTTIVLAVFYATVVFLGQLLRRREPAERFDRFRGRLGRALLVGLEVLVAADVIRTVTLDPTLTGIAGLGLLVVIRTFLSWSLEVELEGRWPWQGRQR